MYTVQCEVFLRILNYSVLLVQKRDLFTAQCMQRELLLAGDSWMVHCRPAVGKSDTFDKLGLICAARLMSLFSHKPSIARHHLREKA